MRPRETARMLLGVLLALSLARGAAAAGVVSLNLCTDQYLMLLAPERIAALSPLARDPSLSVLAATARQFPQVRASAEAVLRLAPDLVLAAPYGAQPTLALLESAGIRVVRIALAQDFAAIREQTRSLAALLGASERGAALIAGMDARLAAIPGPRRPLRALWWQPRGYSAGPGSLGDAVLRAAGLTDVGTGGRIGLEALLRLAPDLLVVPDAAAAPSLATALLVHPATAAMPRRAVPPALTICAGPWTAEAAALLAR
jgi:iron complex transport system substrate-binding protein